MPEPASTRFPEIPGYRLESILGRGSMATVYRGRQEGMERPVAVKVLREEILESRKTVDRLMREARIAARFNHPHIVRALDAGVHEGSCYFVMELIEGRSLRDIVEREGPLDEERVLDIAIEVGEALHELQGARVVHRDVKPANIILDEDGKTLLADLGLAKIELDASMTSEQRSVGTPAYMSPEQARDPDKVDSRSDLFSFGATLFYLLTGNSPFDGGNVSTTITKLLYEEAPLLRQVAPDVSIEMGEIVARLLDKDPVRRYQTPATLLRDLRALRRGSELPVGSAPPLRNRKPWLLAAGAVVALVLILALSGVFSDPEESRPEPRDDEARAEKLLAEREAEERRRQDIERRSDEIIQILAAETRTRLVAEDVEGAQKKIDGGPLRIAAALDLSEENWPRYTELRWETEKLKLQGELSTLRSTIEQRRMESARGRLFQAAAGLADREIYLDRDSLIDALKKVELRSSEFLTEEKIETLRAEAAERVLARWREDFERAGSLIRGRIKQGRLGEARELIAKLAKREPELLGSNEDQEMDLLSGQVDRREKEAGRRIERALELIDVLPPAGAAELTRREFAALGNRLDEHLGRLLVGAESREAESLRILMGLLVELDTWPVRLVETIEARETLDGLVLETLAGKKHRPIEILTMDEDHLEIRVATSDLPVELPMDELASATFESILPPDDQLQRARALTFLDYGDRRLAEAEMRAAALAADDPLRLFLGPRLEAAWVQLERVETPLEKEAFGVWRQVLTAYREGRFEEAEELATPLRKDREIKKTAWYKARRKEIRRVLDELEKRGELRRQLGPVAGYLDVVALAPPLLQGSFSFDDKREIQAFRLPPGHGHREGELARLVPAPSGVVAPTELEPLVLPLPVDLEQPFRLDLEIATAKLPERKPRCLTISVGGCHIAILSRLRQTLGFRHLQLHGVEKQVVDFVELGKVAAWCGSLEGYRDALLKAGPPGRLTLETNRSYRIAISIDPAKRSLVLLVDDEEILRKELPRFAADGSGVEIRAAMPYALTSLAISAGLKLD